MRVDMRVLLGSGGLGTKERTARFKGLLTEHFEGCSRILFIPLASANHQDRVIKMRDLLGMDESNLVLIDQSHAEDQIQDVDGIYMGGGNSFLLIQELHRLGIVKAIRESVKNGMPYVGVSAGSNVACPTMMTTNDMPIVLPETFDSLGIVPFQINPHYYPGKITFTHQGDQHPHYGESRAQRISEYHMLHDTPVLGMWEGSYVHWDGEQGKLIGTGVAFYPDKESLDLRDGAVFDKGLNLRQSSA